MITRITLGTLDKPWRRQHAHRTGQRVPVDQIGDVRRIVGTGVRIPARGLFNEDLVELLAPAQNAGALLRIALHVLGQPRRPQGGQPPIIDPASAAKTEKEAGSMTQSLPR